MNQMTSTHLFPSFLAGMQHIWANFNTWLFQSLHLSEGSEHMCDIKEWHPGIHTVLLYY